MMSNKLSVLVAVLAAAATVAIALPVGSIHREAAPKDSAPPPPAPGTSCLMLNESACVSNDCCNWCAPSAPIPPIANVTIGFCMPMIPAPPTPVPGGLVCDKTPTDCKSVVAMSSCTQFPECQWVPFGPPGTAAGMCVFNWTRCKSPTDAGVPEAHEEAALARLAAKKAAEEMPKPSLAPVGTSPAPTPKPPKPTMCNMTTAEPCDDCECCQWCSTPINLTGGFCMTLGPFPPPPALNCSKGAIKCEALKTLEACEDAGLCAWLPISPTKGKCLFNWNKCKLPPSYGPEV